ncbi:hypothetical protein QN277_013789, partial [Acacia crassicarpa]
ETLKAIVSVVIDNRLW